MGRTITLNVNGTSYTREIEPRLLLVHFIREDLSLTGTVTPPVVGLALFIWMAWPLKVAPSLRFRPTARMLKLLRMWRLTACTPCSKVSGRSTAYSVATAPPA